LEIQQDARKSKRFMEQLVEHEARHPSSSICPGLCEWDLEIDSGSGLCYQAGRAF
jgi:hypothetical protein